jgi:hypothetical protein
MGLGMAFGFTAFYDPSQPWLDNRIFNLMVQRTFGAMTNDTLLSIPLFVLMGYVMERGALVDKMFHSVQLAFRRLPGSLAVATLVICTFWGIASGLGRGGADGRDCHAPHVECGLRHPLGCGRDHGWRYLGHFDSTVGDDHCVRRGGRSIGGQAVCRSHVPRLLLGFLVFDLCHRLGAD